MICKNTCSQSERSGFSLVEVVLAIGIFLVTVLALVGLLGPTLKSVNEVEMTDEVASVVNTVNAFLQSSPDIALGDQTKFEVVYELLRSQGAATLYVYRWYDDSSSVPNHDVPVVKQEIGFYGADGMVGGDSIVNGGGRGASFTDASGSIYAVVVSASSVTPDDYKSEDATNDIYRLKEAFDAYPEGYLALEVRVFDRELIMSEGNSLELDEVNSLSDYASLDPVFTYNTAIVR